jgi:mycothiol synthase
VHPVVPGWPYRPATLADVPALTALLDSISRVHLGRPTTELEVRQRLGVPGCYLATDSFVVPDANGRLLAFGHVWLDPPADVRAFARVHPDARGLGIGPSLAKLITTRGRQLARTLSTESVRFSTTAWAADEGAPSVLAAAGLVAVRHFQRMTRDLPGSLAEPTWPPGVIARPYRPAMDEDALFAAYRVAFGEHWGSESPDPVRWWWDVRDSPDCGYDPELWTVAEAATEIVGFAIGRVRDRGQAPEGYVSFLGVLPPHRHNGLGRALLTRQLAQFRTRGLPHATLDVDVDNVTTALDLYRSVGMTPVPSFTVWAASMPGALSPVDEHHPAVGGGR